VGTDISAIGLDQWYFYTPLDTDESSIGKRRPVRQQIDLLLGDFRTSSFCFFADHPDENIESSPLSDTFHINMPINDVKLLS